MGNRVTAADTGWRGDVHAALKRHQPVRVVARIGDQVHEAAVVPGREKWLRVVDSLPRDAERIELLDAKDRVLWAQDLDEPALMTRPSEYDGKHQELASLAKIIVEAQEQATRSYREMFAQFQAGWSSLAATLGERLGSMEKQFAEVTKLAYQGAQAAGYSDGKDNAAGQVDPSDFTDDMVLNLVKSKFNISDADMGMAMKMLNQKGDAPAAPPAKPKNGKADK